MFKHRDADYYASKHVLVIYTAHVADLKQCDSVFALVLDCVDLCWALVS